jgi:hypothetical protein
MLVRTVPEIAEDFLTEEQKATLKEFWTDYFSTYHPHVTFNVGFLFALRDGALKGKQLHDIYGLPVMEGIAESGRSLPILLFPTTMAPC